MTTEIKLADAINSYPDVVDFLTYRCYIYNRQRSPDITPEQWATILPNVPTMERQYQEELKANENKR